MRGAFWKISTFGALALAGFFAIRPLHSASSATSPTLSPKDAHAAATSGGGGGGLFSFLGFGGTDAPVPATASVADKIADLRAAKTQDQQCDALSSLANAAGTDEAAGSAIADYTSAKTSSTVRACAVRSLGSVRTGASTSWLTELLQDEDRNVRLEALSALIGRIEDDADARSAVLAAAHGSDHDLKVQAIAALGNAGAPEASALLQEAIATETGQSQVELISALGNTKDKGAAALLAKLVNEGSAEARNAAINALGSLGGDVATAALGDILGKGTRQDAEIAAQALARIGDESAKQHLLDAVNGDVRGSSIAALRALTQIDDDQVHDMMAKTLVGSDPERSGIAAGYFSAHRDKAALPALLGVAKSGDQRQLGMAINAIGNIGGPEAVSALTDLASRPGPAQDQALAQLGALPEGHEKARALALDLAKKGGPAANTAFNMLAQDGSPEARDALIQVAKGGSTNASSAMQSLAQQGDPTALKALGDIARNGKDVSAKEAALQALASTGSPSATPVFIAAAKDSDPRIRQQALAGLGATGSPEAERVLVDATKDANRGVAATALQSLSRMGTPGAVAQLEKLSYDKDPQTARIALAGLARTAPDKAAVAAGRMMQSPDKAARLAAVQTAATLAPAMQQKIWTQAARDEDPSVARDAVSRLGSTGTPEAQATLIDLLRSEGTPKDVRTEAADQLHELGGTTADLNSSLIDKYRSPDESNEDDGEGLGFHGRGGFDGETYDE
ncbi:hypothetical protein BH09MYX1_BH09MYX1_35290 [soil metagenome]